MSICEAVNDADEEALRAALAGGDVDALNDDGLAAVHLAAQGEPGCLKILIDHKANVNLESGNGTSALTEAVKYGDANCVSALIEAGADQTFQDEGKTPLQWAEEGGDATLVELLGGKATEQEEVAKPKPASGRRGSVSSETVDPNADLDITQLPQTEKDPEVAARLRKIMLGSILFQDLDTKTLTTVINAMSEVGAKSGETVIKQGDDGDFFYIVEAGSLDCYVQKDAALLGKELGTKVLDYAAGQSFGELSLMYNTPRAASLVATSDCVLWAMERVVFRSIVMTRIVQRRQRSEEVLRGCALFASLDANTLSNISDALVPCVFEAWRLGANRDPAH